MTNLGDPTFATDEFVAREAESGRRSTIAGGQALGQGIARGGENFERGRQFNERTGLQRERLEEQSKQFQQEFDASQRAELHRQSMLEEANLTSKSRAEAGNALNVARLALVEQQLTMEERKVSLNSMKAMNERAKSEKTLLDLQVRAAKLQVETSEKDAADRESGFFRRETEDKIILEMIKQGMGGEGPVTMSGGRVRLRAAVNPKFDTRGGGEGGISLERNGRTTEEEPVLDTEDPRSFARWVDYTMRRISGPQKERIAKELSNYGLSANDVPGIYGMLYTAKSKDTEGKASPLQVMQYAHSVFLNKKHTASVIRTYKAQLQQR